ncbi:hypothetical protein [Rhizobium sp. TRM95796]|uniref:hypothetical protein n=1 Tax=Rhizobium sp. TRM95796 TaxID=2979862 RepID=UPI0021E943EF|nr:hypothetical protein [Rhizobium sp. TRM95796]MCV3765147.1 hypothetical protein [Rhizobium sp. TRM95796]
MSENMEVLKGRVLALSPWEQKDIVGGLPIQVLLSALYDKTSDLGSIYKELRDKDSMLNVFDERARLRTVVEKFGETILRFTDAQFQKGERSNGWRDLSHTEMQDIVIEALMTSLGNAMRVRKETRNIEGTAGMAER